MDFSNTFQGAPFLAALTTGLFTGSSYCLAGCAPFISTYIMGTGNGAGDGLRLYIFFISGRIITYVVIGIAAGYMGEILDMKGPGLPFLSGIFFIISGIILCLRDSSRSKACGGPRFFKFYKGSINSSSMHLFLAGILLSIVPCPPLIAVMAGSLQYQSVIIGSSVMLLFGLGTMLSPLVLVAGAAGFLSKRIKESAPRNSVFFQRIAGVIIMMMGGYYIISIYQV